MKTRRRVLDELRDTNPKFAWSDSEARHALTNNEVLASPVTVGDVLDILELVGLVVGERRRIILDGQCNGITLKGRRCKCGNVLDGFCLAHQDQAPSGMKENPP